MMGNGNNSLSDPTLAVALVIAPVILEQRNLEYTLGTRGETIVKANECSLHTHTVAQSREGKSRWRER